MKRSPIQRKTPLRAGGLKPAKATKPPRPVWIVSKPKQDLSSMTCCKEARLRAGRLVLMGCIVCGKLPQIHHLRDGHGLGERAPWWETIPLCHEHHNGSQLSTHGALRREFHGEHGSEREMLERVNARLSGGLLGP